jgi:hypothetical protein
MNDSIGDAPAASDVVVEEEQDMILETLIVFAGVTGDQELLCYLWDNVARRIRDS